jgi:hypothetical protein
MCCLFFAFLENSKAPRIVIGGGLCVAAIQMISFLITFLKNPGIPQKRSKQNNVIMEENSDNSKECSICLFSSDKNSKTHHCSECGICIEGFDHHCPWTSKCVGKGNLIPFYVFVLSTMLLFGYLIFSVSLIPQ